MELFRTLIPSGFLFGRLAWLAGSDGLPICFALFSPAFWRGEQRAIVAFLGATVLLLLLKVIIEGARYAPADRPVQ